MFFQGTGGGRGIRVGLTVKKALYIVYISNT